MPGNEDIFDAIIQYEARGAGDVLADAAKIDAAIQQIDGSVDVKVNVNDSEVSLASLLVADLGEDQSLKVNVDDSEIDASILLLDDLSEDQTAKVNVESSELDDVKQELDELQRLAVIDIVLNLSGQAQGIISTLQSLPGLGAVADVDRAENILQAQSGVLNPEEAELAKQLYTDAFFESQAAAAQFINQLKGLGVEGDNLEATALGAIRARDAFTAMGKEADLAEIATAQNALVLNGLVDDATEASDLIAAGVLSGTDRRDDFLDTIREYSSTFRDAGFSGEEAINAINSGLEAGFDNTDRIADLVREFNLRARNPEETAAQESLADLGLADEAEAFRAGELAGAEFFRGVLEAIQAEDDAGLRQQFAANIFGSQAEDFGVQTALGIDPIEQTFTTIEGRAEEVSTLINDNLGTVFTELFNTINAEAGELLSSDALNLDEKLDDIKTRITGFLDDLSAGISFGEALEVNFGISGVDEFVGRAQSVFGNVIIALLEVVAAIQDLRGVSSEGTRAEIARLAAPQLAFDLKVANEDEVAGLVQTALDRGVEGAALGDAVSTAVEELLASGQIEQAQALVDALEEVPAAFIEATDLLGNRLPTLEISGDLDADQTQAAIDAATRAQPLGVNVEVTTTDIDVEGLQAQVDAAAARAAIVVPVKPTFERTEDADLPEVLPAFRDVAPTDDLVDDLNVLIARMETAETLLAARARATEGLNTEIGKTAPAQQIGEISATAVEDAATVTALVETGFANTLALMTQAAEDESFNIDAAMQTIEDSVTAMGDTTYDVIQGNTVTEDFATMAASALENSGIVVGAMGEIEASLDNAGAAAGRFAAQIESALGQVVGLVGQSQSLFAQLSAAGGFGAGISNQTTNVNVAQYNNINSPAQAVSADAQVASTVLGIVP